jgi:coenzyme F420-dependent glucose-6-phosphate dehydrogenase
MANEKLVKKFRVSDDGEEKPCYGQMTVCWGKQEEASRKIAMEWWPTAVLPGKLMTELATPAHFEAATKLINEDAVASSIVCGPEKYLAEIKSFTDAGFDHIYIHQVGPDQEGFFSFMSTKYYPSCIRRRM